jgi:chaperonin GroEL (HSP60 family)
MKWEIENPRILLLSNSIGYIKDEQEFLDLETEIK